MSNRYSNFLRKLLLNYYLILNSYLSHTCFIIYMIMLIKCEKAMI